MIAKLCKVPNAIVAILGELEEMCSIFTKNLTQKLRDSAVQQERDRHADLQKSILSTVDVLTKVNGASDNAKFVELLNKTVLENKDLKELYDRIHKEAAGGDGS
eukprot:NODE_2230_length_495_cov_418.973094_g1823_i0.p1 GENE.NODE_2230_length_495_cov_418.973094_g1823_i0~~NODE_2230_length_495_cov_418.973094_g1823_i0.p1  ORF type:complete len:104 (-),score=13.80 NODE_2230_length_495_cov_418.973094_g1823_i0:147-458(-)